MELGEPDASGRRRPIPVRDSAFDMELDAVIMAIGTSPNPLIKSTTKGLETQKWGGIVADGETFSLYASELIQREYRNGEPVIKVASSAGETRIADKIRKKDGRLKA